MKCLSEPLVSIVVLNYNGQLYLEKCLKSLEKLNYPNFEVILVDNASTDGSVDYVQSYFPWVRVIKNRKNFGYAKGNNIGIAYAKGEFIVLLNMDTYVCANWLSKLIESVQTDLKIGACGGKFYDYYKKRPVNVHRYCRIDKNKRPYDIPQEVATLYGAGILVRRKVFENIGLFDSTYFMYFEEIDLCWRMRLAGFRCVYVPDAIVYHPEEGSGLLPSEAKIYLNFRNWLRTIVKNCGAFALPIYVCSIALRFGIAFAMIFSPNGRLRRMGLIKLKSYPRALLWNLLNLKDTLLERRRVQRLRKLSDRKLNLYNLWLSFDYFLAPL